MVYFSDFTKILLLLRSFNYILHNRFVLWYLDRILFYYHCILSFILSSHRICLAIWLTFNFFLINLLLFLFFNSCINRFIPLMICSFFGRIIVHNCYWVKTCAWIFFIFKPRCGNYLIISQTILVQLLLSLFSTTYRHHF